MRKIFGVAGAIALSIIPNPVFSEDMPPVPNPGPGEYMPPIPSPDPRNEEERRRELKERRRKAEERNRKIEERRRKAEERRRELEGDHGFVDTEVSQVLVQGTSDRFDRSLCKLTNGAFVLCELTAEVGLPAMDITLLQHSDRRPFDATDVVGLVRIRKGFGAIIKQGEKFTLQKFRWRNSAETYSKTFGKPDNITRKIYDIETAENQDFNGDQLIGVAIEGDQLIGGKIEVVRTIFPGNDKFDRGLYEFKATKSSGSEIYGGLVVSGMGLQPGDTILENDAIKILDRQGREFPAYRDVIGMYPITRGIALIYKTSVLMEQGFRFQRKNIFTPIGKPRKATELGKERGDICYHEEKMDYDFDGNLIIGCN